jgi:hypothetical protein
MAHKFSNVVVNCMFFVAFIGFFMIGSMNANKDKEEYNSKKIKSLIVTEVKQPIKMPEDKRKVNDARILAAIMNIAG